MVPEFEKTSDLIELALDAGEIGCWVWDATSNRLAWDKRAFVITGAWPTPPKLASFLAAIHPDDRSTLEKRWREAIAEGPAGRFQCEFRLTRPSDGQRRWIAASGRVEAPASRAHQSQPLRLIGVMRDVSDRRAAADNAEAHSARLAGIVAIAADAIISIDDTQTITLFNDGAAAIFGYASDEIIGQPLALLIPEASRDGHAAHIHAFATSGEPSRRMGERGEIHGRRKSGDVFPAEASISRIDVGGERI